MKKTVQSISNPDELNRHLQYTSPITWIVLGFSICALVGFLAWSCIYKLKEKISGAANIVNGEVVLVVEESKISRLEVGQKVYILDQEGEILSVDNNKPVVSSFNLNDGEYTYTIVLKEIRPIDFLIGK